MRLHHVTENLARDYAGHDWFEDLRSESADVAQFDFGNISAIPRAEWDSLKTYAVDLIRGGLFRLPYASVAYSYRTDGQEHIVLGAECLGAGRLLNAVAWKRQASIDVEMFANFNLDLTHPEQEALFYVPGHLFVNRLPPVLLEKLEIVPGKLVHDAAKNCGSCFLVLTALLNAQGVETTLVPAPTKLNAKRIKSGKPSIQAIREVRVRVGARTYSIAGTSEDRHHASPRLHWRRGHVRRLSGGNLTNVRPALVGAVGVETPALPNYHVSN